MEQPFGAGAFLTTDVEHVDLGEHHGTRIRARVERRLLRIGFGTGAGFRLVVGRTRPTRLHLSRGTRVANLPFPAARDPWLQTAFRLAIVTVATFTLRLIAPAPRPRTLQAHRHGGLDGTD